MADTSSLLFAHVLSPEDPCWDTVLAMAYGLREQVFQIGQGISREHDQDAQDALAIHFLASLYRPGEEPHLAAIATGRAVRTEDGFKIGRVCTLPRYQRGQNRATTGVGSGLMDYIIRTLSHHHPDSPLYLNAQADPDKDQDVVSFYERLGFKVVGEPFDIVGIQHQRMELP